RKQQRDGPVLRWPSALAPLGHRGEVCLTQREVCLTLLTVLKGVVKKSPWSISLSARPEQQVLWALARGPWRTRLPFNTLKMSSDKQPTHWHSSPSFHRMLRIRSAPGHHTDVIMAASYPLLTAFCSFPPERSSEWASASIRPACWTGP
ncbi:mCG145074, partial [Mus musculus]